MHNIDTAAEGVANKGVVNMFISTLIVTSAGEGESVLVNIFFMPPAHELLRLRTLPCLRHVSLSADHLDGRGGR